MKSKRIISTILVLTVIMQLFGINIFSAGAIEQTSIDKMVEIAKNEIGYLETVYSDGSFYSKYGDWYGYSKEPWCAMFVSWCANEASVSNNVIPKFSSCNKGREWFVNKDLWKTKDEYEPKSGDIVFLNNCTHVGIVEKYDDGIVYTIEGNASDEDGENFGVRRKIYSLSSSKITGFGIPDLNILGNFNGVANKKSPAYMLPDNTSQEVWEVWQNDELEVLCSKGNYYLVMYPFLSTGKFVCAYVDKTAVNVFESVPSYKDFFQIKNGKTLNQTNLYHNPSNSSLLSNSGEDKSVRAVLSKNTYVTVLFERDGYYFLESDGLTGFANRDNIELDFVDTPLNKNHFGDVNCDGDINILDATEIQHYLAEFKAFNAAQITNADVNGDNVIDVIDVSLIQKYIADFISVFPAEIQETTSPISTTSTAQNISIKEIILPLNFSVYLDEEKQLEYNVLPENADKKDIYWLSVDDNIVSITSEGKITGKGVGTTKIIAFTTYGVRYECSVTVLKRNIEAQSITIDNANPNILTNGETIKLNATVYPSDTTDKSIIWSSSNPDIASVDSTGLVTAKTAGTVTITAYCQNSAVNATAIVRVNQTTSYIPNGNYCLKLKDTNSYLDHQGGVTNGTNVHLWSGDGNSNPNQKIKLERIDDNRYMLKSAVNNDLLLDVNRGSSYSDPISIGKNIDLWQNNDWEAQEWLFTKTYDGYYIIRLNMYKGGAIEAGGKNNGDNIFFGTYNPDNDMQKWELITTSEYVEPESNYWVCNTQDIGNVNVRSGPGTNYPSIGGFNEGQQITVIGGLQGDWYKVRGANRHDGSIITGYSHKDYFSPNPPTPAPVDPLEAKFNELKTKYRHGEYWNKYNSTDCSRTGTIPCRCNSTCTATCSCSCGEFRYNGYAVAWQCHGYALRLGYEIYGNNPNTWSRNKDINSVRPGDIIRFWNDGHSVMVTKVTGDNITFTDCNRVGPCKVQWGTTWSKSKFTGITYIAKHP